MQGCRISIHGTVQGVGFRPWVYRVATTVGLGGRIRNDAAGVTIEVFGPAERIEGFLQILRQQPPAPGKIRALSAEEIPAEAPGAFVIEASAPGGAVAVSIPPDLATCPRCLEETRDAGDRRHGYPFTNCTACGPRFTIARAVPYDRPATSMARFPMCPDCQREYDDPGDRRFHAQPNACPTCGPRVVLTPAACDGDPITAAAARLCAGRILAVRGLGGFHLACDATSEAAVATLRARKRREEKPFAVMVRDLDAARRLAVLSGEETALLCGPERPIVLLERRAGTPLADGVSPDSPLVGIFLAYTPLHDLLCAAAARPLVMTSANLSDEPIARTDEDAGQLAGVWDDLLTHDREIVTRCDDSVARVIAGAPTLIRRSRGFVPRPVVLRRPVPRPILAVGGQLKNAFCLARGDLAYMGPHVGDLDNPTALDFFREAVERMERLVQIRPEVIAHDLHPDYLSTREALAMDGDKVAVQHHHAHVASAMAEHGLDGPVLGVAFDGTGYGLDGTSWGGEILRAGHGSFERLATFRPIRLAGGELAIRQPWRIALALLEDAFDGDAPCAHLPLFRAIPERELRIVRRMLEIDLNCPRAHGVGRLFDGVAALALARPRAAHEGQLAVAWNHAAANVIAPAYPFDLATGATPWQIDLRPMVRAIAGDVCIGTDVAVISARFHATVVAATAHVVRALADGLPVVLSGGCFVNPLLTEGLIGELADLDVRLQRAVPPGDGGLALGQVAVAACA